MQPQSFRSRILTLVNCSTEEGLQSYQLLPSGKNLYLTWTTSVEDDQYEGLTYARHFVAAANFSAANALTCDTAINIPGEPLKIEGDHLVTRDSRLLDVIANEAEGSRCPCRRRFCRSF